MRKNWKWSALVLAMAMATSITMAKPTRLVDIDLVGAANGGQWVVVELDTQYPQDVMYEGRPLMQAFEEGLVQEIVGLIPEDAAKSEGLAGALGGIITMGSCDDAEDCARTLKASCAKQKTGVKSAVYLAPAGTRQGSCDGVCDNGVAVTVVCARRNS